MNAYYYFSHSKVTGAPRTILGHSGAGHFEPRAHSQAPTNISQPAREAVDHERTEDSPDFQHGWPHLCALLDVLHVRFKQK